MELPPEIIYLITAFCDSQTKARCSQVCKLWNVNTNWTVDELNQTLLHACHANRINTVLRLLEDHRVDPSHQDNLCMRVAAKKHHTDIFCVLDDDSRTISTMIHDRDFRVMLHRIRKSSVRF